MENNFSESLVTFRHHSGAEIRAGLLRLNRYVAAFEVYSPSVGLCLSDVLGNFRVSAGESTIFSGRAVLTGIVNTGPLLVCEAALDECGFQLSTLGPNISRVADIDFGQFLRQWQKLYRVLPEFKIATADMNSFLTDLRLWMDQVELDIRSAPAGSRAEKERETVERISQEMTPLFNEMHERLESVSSTIDEESRPAHQGFCRRQLHALTMCSPFAYRTFHKPLGYAGDYEMVNMMLRPPFEGASAYSKVVNHWFIAQWPALAHRNRISYLTRQLEQECLRLASRGRSARILNLGCGPAHEVIRFLAQSPVSDYAELTLLDFNEETLHYAKRQIEEARIKHHRRSGLTFQKRSVQQLIKESARPVPTGNSENRYDLIYCAGLFDYLSERTCRQLMGLFYEWLEPGGLLTATNVQDSRPFRHMLEFILDWHLIYRTPETARALFPQSAPPEDCVVLHDDTGVNLFMEARKSVHG